MNSAAFLPRKSVRSLAAQKDPKHRRSVGVNGMASKGLKTRKAARKSFRRATGPSVQCISEAELQKILPGILRDFAPVLRNLA